MEQMGIPYMLKTLSLILVLVHMNWTSLAELEEGIITNSNSDEDSWSMVQKNGNQFMLDGQPFYVNGFNTYWLMIFAVDESTRPKVSDVFQQASGVGLSVCRTWAFNDGGWRALQQSPNVYDEQVFKVWNAFKFK